MPTRESAIKETLIGLDKLYSSGEIDKDTYRRQAENLEACIRKDDAI